MKRILTTALLLLVTILVAGCGTSSSANFQTEQITPQITTEPDPTFTAQSAPDSKSVKSSLDAVTLSEIIHIDLSELNKTMAYAAMYDLVVNAKQHVGKTVKLRGSYQSFQLEDPMEFVNYILVVDNAACCEIGMEFILTGEHSYPDDYPPILSEIELVGIMRTVEYEGFDYPRLIVNEIKTIESSDLNLITR